MIGYVVRDNILLKRCRTLVERDGSDIQKDAFDHLYTEVNGYHEEVAANLLEERKFNRSDDGNLDIPPEINDLCEAHRTECNRILEIVVKNEP